MNRRHFLAGAAALPALGFVLPAIAADPTFSREQVRGDLAALYAGMQEAHFDLFVHTSKPAYDQAYRQTLAAIREPMSRTGIEVLFQTFLAIGKVAHARIDFPAAAWSAYRDGGGPSLPLDVRVVEGRVYVARNFGGGGVEPGDEVVSLDGAPTPRWLQRVARHVSADNSYMSGALVESQLPRLLWLEFGPRPAYRLGLRKADGRRAEATIRAGTSSERAAAAAALPAVFELDGYSREARMIDDVAYLKPGPFFNIENMEKMWDTAGFHAFIDTSFARFKAAGARRLVIDLRDNPGGDNSFSDHLVAWFADKPFRFCSRFRIKVSPQAKASNQARLDGDPEAAKGVSGDFARLYNAARPGDVVDFPIAMVQPRQEDRFEGEVLLLINRRSYSNTVTVAALAQDLGFARILGEETSDLASTYGAMEQFTLPVTGIAVGFPKAHIIRPSGDPTSRGVVPDIAIAAPIAPVLQDVMLERALAIARAPSQPAAA
jgi:hypothetical protein